MFWKNKGHDHFVFFSITINQMVGIGVKVFFMQICQNCTVMTIETSPTNTAISGRSHKYWYAVPYPSSFHWWEGIKYLPWEVNSVTTGGFFFTMCSVFGGVCICADVCMGNLQCIM